MADTSWGLISPLSGTSATSDEQAKALMDNRISQANNALTWLKEHIDSATSKSAIVRHNVPIHTSVHHGSLVYYNAEQGTYYPAKAVLLPESTAGGRTIEGPEARVEGIIIDIYQNSENNIVGTMLCGGYWVDQTAMDWCLIMPTEQGATNEGTYYLSPSAEGKATKDTYGHLRQPVLTYYGNGAFGLNLFYLAHDNHFHSSQILGAGWIPVTGTDIPENAQFVYDGPIDMGLGTLGDTTAVFYKGVLQIPYSKNSTNPQFAIQGNKLYCLMSVYPNAGEVVLFNHYPFAYENAIIRSIYSDSKSLTVENTNGIIKLTANDFIAGAITPSAYAVSGIQDNTISFTPIVANVYAGPGIDVTRAIDGGVFVSTASMIGSLIDAYTINHNGTTLVSAGALEYITFQAGRTSNFVMTAPVKGITSACNVKVWGMLRGANGGTVNLEVAFIPDPTTVGTVNVVSQTSSIVFEAPAGGDANSLTYGETATAISGMTVSTDGLLVAKVSATTGDTQQLQLLRAGFKLLVDGAAVSDQGETVVDTSRSIRQTITAGEALDAGDAVYVKNGYLFKCVNSITNGTDTTNLCIGIVETGATVNNQATYVSQGSMLLTNAPGTSGSLLYIGRDGHVVALTASEAEAFIDPNDEVNGKARYLQKVGTVLASNIIQINIEPAIRSSTSA